MTCKLNRLMISNSDTESIKIIPSRNILLILLLIILTLFLFTAGCGEQSENILRAFEDAHNNQDIDRILRIISDDITFEISNDWMIDGKESFRVYAEWDAAINSLFRFDNLQIRGDTIHGRLIETNDWFNLMGIKAVIYDSVTVVIENNLITHITASQKTSNKRETQSKFESFIRWAADERSSELVGLMDGPSFVFRKENASRWLRLLEEWHLSTLDPPNQSINIHTQYNHENRTLTTDQVIEFRNLTQTTIQQIAFDRAWDPVQPYFVSVNGLPARPVAVFQQNVIDVPVIFDLSNPVEPGQMVKIEIQSEMDIDISALSSRLDPYLLINWFPQIWWGRDIEYVSDYTITLSGFRGFDVTPSCFSTFVNGVYRADNIRSLALLIKRTAILKIDSTETPTIRTLFPVTGYNGSGEITISTLDAVEFMRDHFKNFPYPLITILSDIETENTLDLPTGIASTEIPFLGNTDNRSLQKWCIAQRVAEHYFGEEVIPAINSHWITKGLSLYLATRFTESRKLRVNVHEMLTEIYLNAVILGMDTTIDNPLYFGRHSSARQTLVLDYGKGYSIISALSVILGDSRMDRIVRKAYQQFEGKRIDLYDFRGVCERISGGNLEWFFDQWVRSNAYLSYTLDDVESEFTGGRYVTTAEVVRTGSIRMPIPVAAYFADGSYQIKFTDRKLDVDIVTFESITPLTKVVLDPENRLPMLNDENISMGT